MRRSLAKLTLAAPLALLSACAAPGEPADVAFVNASWFDGERFVARDVYVRDGRFVEARTAARTVDLGGAYAAPPLCEAHSHNLGGLDEPEAWIRRFLEDGVFYVAIMSNLPALTDQVRHLFNRPTSVDVSFANAPFTGPRGHPVILREFLLRKYGAYPGFTVETLPNQGYVEVASLADLDRLWPIALAAEPDFVKVMVINSDRHAEICDDPAFEGRRGIDPALLPALIERAHQAGLRVAVHTENAADLHAAVAVGADVIAHLPASSRPNAITAEDAALVARSGAIVVTTASLARRLEDEPERFAEVVAVQRENLRLLHDAGVPIAVGSDMYDDTSRLEAEHLHRLGVLSDAEILDAWTRVCAQAVLPDREAGAIAPGYEASFIAFDTDPLADWSAIDRIVYRFKDGVELVLDAGGEEEREGDDASAP